MQNILKGKIVIVGIGNVLKAEDGAGPLLIEKLKGKTKAVCIDAGSTPESYTATIARENPDTILLVDATHLGLNPGQYEVLKADDILKSGFTTHDISPAMFIDYLKKNINANIYMLGIQPENISLGEEMSESVKKSLDEITKLIKETTNA